MEKLNNQENSKKQENNEKGRRIKRRLIITFFEIVFIFCAVATIVLSTFTNYPVEYMHCGVDDYINGNCIKEYSKGVHSLPLFTEKDEVIDDIKNGRYSKEELLEIAQKELKRMQEYNDSYLSKQEYIARIQSFIDIVSRL